MVPPHLLSEISRILSAVRAGLDANSYPAGIAEQNLEIIRSLYLRFEEIRFEYRANTSKSALKKPHSDELAIVNLSSALRNLLNNKTFDELGRIVKFRPLNMSRPSRGFTINHRLMDNRISVRDAIKYLIEGIDNLTPSFETRQPDWLSIQDDKTIALKIKGIVPKSQVLAPIRFDIVDGKLGILRTESRLLPGDARGASEARSELVERGKHLVEQLRVSNCDRRVVEAFDDLRDKLERAADIIRLGLTNIACELLCNKAADELPDALHAMLIAQTTGVGLYLSQFPDWQRFVENAAHARIETSDAPQIAQAMADVIHSLESRPDIADPEVPRTLRALRALIQDPHAAGKRALFAAWRTLENLIIKVFNYGADFLTKVATKSSEGVSTAVSRAIVVALMSAALAGAISMTPLASLIPESAWIARAVEVVRGQIQ